MRFSGFHRLCVISTICIAIAPAFAAAPSAAISASPIDGSAPLAVFFDAGSSSADVISYLWEFGDGAASTAKSVTHIYTVSGTYSAKLTVTNAGAESASSQISITVTGNAEGPVTEHMSFRWSITNARFILNHAQPNKDKLQMSAAFNTVDLPGSLKGLAASFSINSVFLISGIIGDNGGFENPDKIKPSFFIELSAKDQLLNVFIANADLSAALVAGGATDATVATPGIQVPVTFGLTIGAQSYAVTEKFAYISTAGASGRGDHNILKSRGSIDTGFFVISRASALENLDGTGHFFEFDGFLAAPFDKNLELPTSGVWTFKFNDANKEVILFDRIKRNGTKITYDQSDRDLGGISHLFIDVESRRFVIRTWDLTAAAVDSGTGLPVRGRPFTALNFAVRMDLDQPDGTTFQAVTATRLTRKTQDDAFWQTGRRNKKQ